MTPDTSKPSVLSDSNTDRDGNRRDTRQRLRRLRQQLTTAAVAEHSSAIAANIHSLLGNAQKIGGYLAFGNEVSVDEFMAQRRAHGQTTYVPLVQPDHTLVFAPITDTTAITQNKYGIREPALGCNTCLPATSLDVVIVPLLGFDPQCNRMGMGGGYYDRSFAHRRHASGENSDKLAPLLIGVAFELQCVENVFPDWWDVPMDHVVTEKRIYSAKGPVIQAS